MHWSCLREQLRLVSNTLSVYGQRSSKKRGVHVPQIHIFSENYHLKTLMGFIEEHDIHRGPTLS